MMRVLTPSDLTGLETMQVQMHLRCEQSFLSDSYDITKRHHYKLLSDVGSRLSLIFRKGVNVSMTLEKNIRPSFTI